MPSSSARCAQFPRAQDKVHYYIKLKDLRDQLKGIERNTDVQEVQYTFDLQLAQGVSSLLLLVFISCLRILQKACCGFKSRRGESSYIYSQTALIMAVSHCWNLILLRSSTYSGAFTDVEDRKNIVTHSKLNLGCNSSYELI